MVRAARPKLAALAGEIAGCERDPGDPEVVSDLRRMQRVLEHQGWLLQRFGELGGHGFDGEARSYLRNLGLTDGDLEKPVHDLSGGQRKLVALVACLIQRPEVLLLDEPESHMDPSRRERIEAMIQAFDGAVVVVSHDRYLLD